MSLETVTLGDFAPLVGQKFRVALNLPQPLDLELISAEKLKRRREPKPGIRESFSLLFRAPPIWNCPQETYPLVHPTHGNLPLVLVPVGRTDQGTELEAIFNFG